MQHCHRVGSPATFSAPPCPNPDCATSVSLPHQSTPSLFFRLLDPALPCSRRRSLPLNSTRHCIILGSELSQPPLSFRPPPPQSIQPGRRSTSDDSSTLLSSRPSPSQRQPAQAVCRVAVLAGLSASRSPTWAFRRPQSQQQGRQHCGPRSPFFCFEQRRERAQDPLLSPLFPPLSLACSQTGQPIVTKKKKGQKNPPSQVDSSTRMKHQHQ